MNKLSRLTALLLALMILLGSVSLAEGGLPIGGTSGLTSDDWADLVDAAEEKLFFTDEGDTGKEITPEIPEQPEKSDSYPYTDVEVLHLIKSDASAEASITASGAALFHEAAGQWQISLGGVWANLSGETGEALTVTRAMMNGQNRAEFRKALGEKNAETGEYADCTQTAVINLIENPPAMFSVSRDASDPAVSDANDGIMTLELANQENMVLVQVVYRIKGTDQPVADAYIGQIAKGSALNTTLTLPRVTGYTASAITGKAGALEIPAAELAKYATFKQPTEADQGSLTLAVTKELSVQDITIYVEYEPALVNFTVKHMQQNITDDYYTEVVTDRQTLTGLTGDPVREGLAKTYPGFTAIWYDPTTTIAADGSTVVEIHYNREYYLLTFDLGGGYGVEPIFARFGADVSVGTPLRAGYTFKEWTYEDGAAVDQMPTTMPVGGGRYKAVWEAADTTYTVVYWRADVDDGDEATPTTYSYWGYETVDAKSGDVLTPSKVGEEYPAKDVKMIADGEEAGYFTYDADATKEKNIDKKTGMEITVTVAGDGTSVVNVYYSRNVYEIRYHFAREKGTTKQISRSTGDGEVGKGSWQTTRDVDSIPSIKGDSYEVKTEEFDGYTYYYIYVKAEYGASTENFWPASAIENANDGNTVIYWGSWAAEKGTGYRRKYGDAHANIVGTYPAMSADMIKDFGDPVAQRMTAWWGEWNDYISEHTYHVYFEALPEQPVFDTDKTYDGKRYVAGESTKFTCAHNGNTRVDPFVYVGYTCVNNTKDTTNDDQANSQLYNNPDCPLDDPETKDKHEGCAYCNVFYYDRNEYTLSFYNYNDGSVKPNEKTLKFGESFTDYNPGEPQYPVGVEPGSMRFVGWYTAPECFDGTEVDWEKGTMPASDLTFYAKWELVKHDVQFWLDVDMKVPVVEYTDVTHGMTIPEKFQRPEDYVDPNEWLETNKEHAYSQYNFDGWYYMDGGVEKRFDIKTMPIKTDMDIYAKWTSNTPVKFVFRYVHVDANGNEIEQLAPPTEGLALPNSPVTMSAKIGTDLTQVPDGNDPLSYIPEVSSHTLDIQVDETKNVFVFKYHMPEKVKYTVQYLAAEEKVVDGKTVLVPIVENGVPKALIKEKTVETDKAVVTENYVPVTQYMPQATQLRLIVSMKEEMNVIQFLYVENKEEAPYNVSHYIVDYTGKASLHTSETNKTDEIDADVAVNKLKDEDIPGYTFAYAKVAVPTQNGDKWEDVLHAPDSVTDTQVLHKLPAAGMHVYLYYEPIKYPFKVQYINATTNEKIKDDKIAAVDEYKPYGSILNTADYVVEIEDHRFVRFDPATWTVDVEKYNSDPTVNVLTIYYELDVADISITKEIVVLTGENTIEPSDEDMNTAFEFTVKLTNSEKEQTKAYVTIDAVQQEMTVTNGTLTFTLQDGQTAIIHDLWVGTQYEIKEADYDSFTTTYSVTNAGTLTALGVDMKVANTFPKYAGELTIKKTDMQENKESAIVKATVGGVDYYLVLNGSNGYTATITGIRPNTDFTVSEINDWTWQYDRVDSISGKISADNMTPTVTITNTYKGDQWLHDESHVINDFESGQMKDDYND